MKRGSSSKINWEGGVGGEWLPGGRTGGTAREFSFVVS